VSSQDLRQRLAAIFAADAAGYSRLMAVDDRATVAALDAARTVFREQIESNQGRVIDMAGDSVLAVFETAAGAVTASLEAQRRLEAASRAQPEERRMRFRIGVHLGDVMEKSDGTIYGDGVNIAARLHALAEPGGIMVSDAVKSALRGKVPAAFHDCGDKHVKNIAEAVRVFRLIAPDTAGAKPMPASTIGPALPDKPSIAVLPFSNISGDPEQEYFVDGITEDIITDISGVSALFVIARNSSFRFKNQVVDVKEIGQRLGVRYVLQGSVRKAGRRVRVTAQLTDAQNGGHVWAERFDRDLEDVFAVQDEVTRRIVDALKIRLTPREQVRRENRPRVDPQVYDLLAKARRTVRRFSADSARAARALLEQALRLDPRFSRAYALLAMVHGAEYFNGWNGADLDHLRRAVDIARKAIEADEGEPRAFRALAEIKLWLREYGEAERAGERAIELDVNHDEGYLALGQVRDFTGRHESAVELFEQALRLDPEHDLTLHFLGRAQMARGDYQAAERNLCLRLERVPQSDMTRAYLASVYGSTGRPEQARRLWKEMLEINPDFSIEHLRRVLPYKDPAWFERFVDGLRKAGLVSPA
jgi:adenylate cyclase